MYNGYEKGKPMRIAFISDIHGSFTALQAVLEDAKKQSVNQYICLGDTVSLGPQPREVLNMLREINSINIVGNHDQAILEPEKAASFEITEHLVPDLHWGHDKLMAEDREFLRSFKPTHELTFPDGVKLLAFHGSPKATTHIIQATTPPELLDEYFEGQTANIFIGGHSHIQMHRRYGDRLILNSGSVGNAFKFAYSPGKPPSLLPWAEYAIITQNSITLNVDLRRVYFDTHALVEIVNKSGLPGAAWWQRQYE
jgi:predicted phosphodiesterase